MKAVIFAGGYGTRLGEETGTKPKPLVEIGQNPILWHIMKIYAGHGVTDFIICLGYKGYMIKEYFANYFLHSSDLTIDLGKNAVEYHDSVAEPWRITLLDTGLDTQTGGRLKRIRDYLGDEDFFLTYGDAVADVNLSKLLEFHKSEGRLATVTAVQPAGRFGSIEFTPDAKSVSGFVEKSNESMGWINGGFFVLSPKVIDYIDDDATIWEQEPMQGLVRDGQLSAYRHEGFWQCMDTLREKQILNQLWAKGQASWKTWK